MKNIVVAVIVVVLIGLIAGCVGEPAPTPEKTPVPEVTPEKTPVPEVTTTPVQTSACSMCHETEATANLEAHTKGGLLVNGEPGCFNYWGCHGMGDATVHTVHPSEVGCVLCHGTPPTIPQKGAGSTTCEMCHGKPNPLEPSEGRLVEIHMERGKDCSVCHVGEISEIHGMK